MGNDLFKIQRLAGCGINLLPRCSNFSILSLQTREEDHLLPSLSPFFSSPYLLFPLPCSNYTVHAILPEIPNWAGIDARQRHEKNIDTRLESLPDPCRPILLPSFSYFFSFFLFSIILFSLSPIFVAMEGRIAESGGVSRINTCAWYNSRRGNSKTMFKWRVKNSKGSIDLFKAKRERVILNAKCFRVERRCEIENFFNLND